MSAARWTPGSPGAVAEGCLCAIQDNGYGYGSGYRDSSGNPTFWVTDGCPLHAPSEHVDHGEPDSARATLERS